MVLTASTVSCRDAISESHDPECFVKLGCKFITSWTTCKENHEMLFVQILLTCGIRLSVTCRFYCGTFFWEVELYEMLSWRPMYAIKQMVPLFVTLQCPLSGLPGSLCGAGVGGATVAKPWCRTVTAKHNRLQVKDYKASKCPKLKINMR